MIHTHRTQSIWLYHIEMISPTRRIAEFSDRHDSSARSVLITVFGDSVTPAGGTVWLHDLIELARVFGYSDRLVRTSVFRLVKEGWFVSQREGRQSLYHLTDRGRAEFDEAEAKIYHPLHRDWDRRWTVAFVAMLTASDAKLSALTRSLRRRGFGRLAPGVWAIPGEGIEPTGAADREAGVPSPPMATMNFGDLGDLRSWSSFESNFGLDAARAGYARFTKDWSQPDSLSRIEGPNAFGLRTVLVHEFRRLRLSDPSLPDQLLSNPWPGDDAYQAAADAYAALGPAADEWLESAHGLAPTARSERFPV